jgi:hypothetical protein
MKKPLVTLLALLVLASLGTPIAAQQSAAPGGQPAAPEGIRTLEGATWSGTDSDGDFYEYTFLKGGHLRYRTNTARKEIVTFENEGDFWAQNGPIVIIVKNYYSTQVGTMKGDRIAGKAWNVAGRRWTWELQERR